MENASERLNDSPAVIDCGVASEETKGNPFAFFSEFTPPPFDRMYL